MLNMLWDASHLWGYVALHALRAAGDVKFTTFISLFSMVLFRIIFSVILGIQMGMGAIGVWIAMVIDWVFRSAFHIWRFKSGGWKKFHVI